MYYCNDYELHASVYAHVLQIPVPNYIRNPDNIRKYSVPASVIFAASSCS